MKTNLVFLRKMHIRGRHMLLGVSGVLLLHSAATQAWATQVPLKVANPAPVTASSDYGVGFDLAACYG